MEFLLVILLLALLLYLGLISIIFAVAICVCFVANYIINALFNLDDRSSSLERFVILVVKIVVFAAIFKFFF